MAASQQADPVHLRKKIVTLVVHRLLENPLDTVAEEQLNKIIYDTYGLGSEQITAVESNYNEQV